METSHVMHPASLPPGSIVGSWRLLARVSQGAHGVVFRAESITAPQSKPVALKFALQPGAPRFVREVTMLSRLQHPNLPHLLGSGEWTSPDGTTYSYLVMDWVEGLTLYSWAQLQPRSSREVMRVLAQGADALLAVHGAGGLHRDVKGDNFLVRPEDGHAVLVDLGSCTFIGAPVITRNSEPPGTPHYQSPQEQRHQWKFRRFRSARYEASAADDVYALGVTAYRLVTGRYPLSAEELAPDDEFDDIYFRYPKLVPPEALVQISPELARWIRLMLSGRPQDRATPVELALGLKLSANNEGPKADLPIEPRRAPEPAKKEAPAQTAPPQEAPAQETLPHEAPPLTPSPVRPWRVWLSAATLGIVLVAGGGGLLHALLDTSSSTSTRNHTPAAQVPFEQAETSGLGELALPEPLSPAEPAPEHHGINAPIPEVPLPGQRVPPCPKPLTEINGGCWALMGNEMPPCSTITYEWRKRCYLPFMSPSRPLNTREK